MVHPHGNRKKMGTTEAQDEMHVPTWFRSSGWQPVSKRANPDTQFNGTAGGELINRLNS